MSRISIIVPVYNEENQIAATMASLQSYRTLGAELIVVDGGSSDATLQLAAPFSDQVLTASLGRATQMNAGAAKATGDLLLFLHADTLLPGNADAVITSLKNCIAWGYFKIRLTAKNPVLQCVETMINFRSSLMKVATGDQAIFVTRKIFDHCHGFAPIALMEDVELSKRLRRESKPLLINDRVTTSSRRWRSYGIVKTIVLMWRLRFAFWIGVNANALARRYR